MIVASSFFSFFFDPTPTTFPPPLAFSSLLSADQPSLFLCLSRLPPLLPSPSPSSATRNRLRRSNQVDLLPLRFQHGEAYLIRSLPNPIHVANFWSKTVD